MLAQSQKVDVVVVVVKKEHIVVGQQHNGHFVDIGLAVEIAGVGNSWHTMDVVHVEMKDAVETAGGGSS